MVETIAKSNKREPVIKENPYRLKTSIRNNITYDLGAFIEFLNSARYYPIGQKGRHLSCLIKVEYRFAR